MKQLTITYCYWEELLLHQLVTWHHHVPSYVASDFNRLLSDYLRKPSLSLRSKKPNVWEEIPHTLNRLKYGRIHRIHSLPKVRYVPSFLESLYHNTTKTFWLPDSIILIRRGPIARPLNKQYSTSSTRPWTSSSTAYLTWDAITEAKHIHATDSCYQRYRKQLFATSPNPPTAHETNIGAASTSAS